MNNRIVWYVDRLSKMSFLEISSRVKNEFVNLRWRYRKSWNINFNIDLQKESIKTTKFSATSEKLINEAERILNREYIILNILMKQDADFWHYDPMLNKKSPLTFGPGLNYRDPKVVGSAKNIWEKSRHHHLTILASAYLITRNEDYATEIGCQLDSWVKENPIPLGINWNSPLEWGVRLISWTYIERFLRDSPAHARLFGPQGLLWNSIYWNALMISQQSSHGSSANNHLIGEMAGLFIHATSLPVFPESRRWEERARMALEHEIHAQTFESGLNREQAFSYHIFSLELFLLAGIEAERIGRPFSNSYKEKVRKMLEVIPEVMDFSGNLPRYGDSDDAFALKIQSSESSRTGWLFNIGRAWLGADVPVEYGEAELTAYLVWPEKYVTAAENYIAPASSVAFEDAGVFVLASERGTSNEILCLADAGPLGFLSIAAHGHQDALAFTLNIGGIPVIVDPGTYVYHSDIEKRDYFRSTKAHNTIEIDDQPQSVPAGIFMYKTKATSKATKWETGKHYAYLSAFHDGYKRLEGEVVHSRDFILEGKNLRISDTVSGGGNHLLVWRLHFAPWCTVKIDGEYCEVKWSKVNGGESAGNLKVKLSEHFDWEIVRGSLEGGWYSRGFNLIEESATLVGRGNVDLPFAFEHILEVNHEG